jgi:DNA-binding CsgD family transcriptional regulator
MSSIESASTLIGAVYDCVTAPERWEGVLRQICTQLSFATGMIAVNATATGQVAIFASVGFTPEWLARAPTYDADAVAMWGGEARIQQYPLEEPILNSQVVDRATVERTRWYKEFGEPQGLTDGVAIALTRDAGGLGNLAFGRHYSAGPVRDVELSQLRLIAPHVRRAVTISRLLDARAVAASTFASALDAFAAAVILVNEDLRIVHTNRAGATMLAAKDPLRSDDGVLALPSSIGTRALRTAVGLSAQTEIKLGRRGMGIPARRADGTAFVAHVLPLRRQELRRGLGTSVTAAVFVAPALSPPRLPGDALALLYDLTPAEVRVFELIADGKPPAEIAVALGVAPSTVKTHLLRLFEKTGCNRQADLIRLAASMSAPS